MFSFTEDTVLDPFLGTATTTLAAMCAGRNSLGYEIDQNFKSVIEKRLENVSNLSKSSISQRLKNHKDFVAKREKEKGDLKHISKKYNFPVMTSQEEEIELLFIENVEKKAENEYSLKHSSDFTFF